MHLHAPSFPSSRFIKAVPLSLIRVCVRWNLLPRPLPLLLIHKPMVHVEEGREREGRAVCVCVFADKDDEERIRM